MELWTSLLVGSLAGISVLLLASRNLFRLLLGVALIAQAANFLVFAAAGLGSGSTPVIAKDASALPEDHPDPLAQALVLTAIVISFGVLAFCLSLLTVTFRRSGGSDTSTLSKTES